MKNLSIIILHYGNLKTTNKAIASIIENNIKFKKLLIIDNKGNFPKLKKSKLKVLKSERNLGYSGGMNAGIKKSLKGSDYLMLLNNDIVFRNNLVNSLDRYFRGNVGIVSPSLRFRVGNKIYFDVGGNFDFFGIPRHTNLKSLEEASSHEAEFVSGAFMLISSDVFKKVGLFDERFFLYYEDVDFCLRTINKGYKVLAITDFYVDHGLGKTIVKDSGPALFYQTKSALLFFKKYKKIIPLLEFLPLLGWRLIKTPNNTSLAMLAIKEAI